MSSSDVVGQSLFVRAGQVVTLGQSSSPTRLAFEVVTIQAGGRIVFAGDVHLYVRTLTLDADAANTATTPVFVAVGKDGSPGQTGAAGTPGTPGGADQPGGMGGPGGAGSDGGTGADAPTIVLQVDRLRAGQYGVELGGGDGGAGGDGGVGGDGGPATGAPGGDGGSGGAGGVGGNAGAGNLFQVLYEQMDGTAIFTPTRNAGAGGFGGQGGRGGQGGAGSPDGAAGIAGSVGRAGSSGSQSVLRVDPVAGLEGMMLTAELPDFPSRKS